MKKKITRILLCVAMVAVIVSTFSMTAFAAGDVAGAIEQTWNTAKTQVQSVVNNVVFPVVPCPRDTSVPGQRDAEATRLPQGRTARPIRIPNPCHAPRCEKTEVSDR